MAKYIEIITAGGGRVVRSTLHADKYWLLNCIYGFLFRFSECLVGVTALTVVALKSPPLFPAPLIPAPSLPASSSVRLDQFVPLIVRRRNDDIFGLISSCWSRKNERTRASLSFTPETRARRLIADSVYTRMMISEYNVRVCGRRSSTLWPERRQLSIPQKSLYRFETLW